MCVYNNLIGDKIMGSIEEESALRKKFVKAYGQAKSEHLSDKLLEIAKKLKLGVFGEDSYKPQDPYYMGLKPCGAIAIFRNDFYQRAVVSIG
jgi:hypothetical protein